MTDVGQEEEDKDSPQKPWTHLPPPPAFPGQPRLSLAAGATVLAQERDTQTHATSIQAEPMNVEMTTEQLPVGLPSGAVRVTQGQSCTPMNIETVAQLGQMNKGRTVGQILVGGQATQVDLTHNRATMRSPENQGPPWPVDQIVSPGCQVGKGVETVQSEDET